MTNTIIHLSLVLLLSGLFVSTVGMIVPLAEAATPPSTCGCAPRIRKAEAPRIAGRLVADFPGRRFPAFARVKGSRDVQPLGPRGGWISDSTYASLQQTVQLLGPRRHVIKECKYDGAGVLVTTPAQPCEVEFFESTSEGGNGSATYRWKLSLQNGVTRYEVESSVAGANSFRVVDGSSTQALAAPNEDGLFSYAYTHQNVGPGTYEYRMMAVCQNGTRTPAPLTETISVQ